MTTREDDKRAVAQAREMCWAVVHGYFPAEGPVLGVVSRANLAHWVLRLPVLDCTTWGQLRSTVTPEVYEEVCELSGYGTFEGYTAHLKITGSVPLPDAEAEARRSFDRDATPPADDEPFSFGDIPAVADGDWPMGVEFAMAQDLPAEILRKYAECTMTTFNGESCQIPATNVEAVLSDLRELGFDVTEDRRIIDWYKCRF